MFNKESQSSQVGPDRTSPAFTPVSSKSSVATDSDLIRAEFVNASFRFMLKATSDYTAYFADSDM